MSNTDNITLSISIVSHNDYNLIKALLKSLYTSINNIIFEIIIIDNASNDDTNLLENSYNNLRVIRRTSPHGFANNHNLCLQEAKGQYILILNPDILSAIL